jgi:hypothetical protein
MCQKHGVATFVNEALKSARIYPKTIHWECEATTEGLHVVALVH